MFNEGTSHCGKSAAAGILPLCKAHGGGQRCRHTGCSKSAAGRTQLCRAHGGEENHGGGARATRCTQPLCDKSARGDTGFCRAHGGQGGERRCTFEFCDKLARGSISFCTLHAHEAHGGGAATTGVNVPNALIDARCTQMEADNKAHNAQVLAEQRESIQHDTQLLTEHHAEYAEAYRQQQQHYDRTAPH